MRGLILAHLALLGVNLLYGANHVLAKGIMPDMIKPNAFIFLRVLGATVLFWIVKLFVKSEKIEKKDWIKIVGAGFFGVAVNQLFFFNGLQQSSAVNSAIIMTTTPILVVILAFFFLKESLSPIKIIGVLVGGTGAVLLTLSGSVKGFDSQIGDLYIFINAMSYGIYLIFARSLMKKYKPITVITYFFTVGLVLVTLFPLTIPELLETPFSTFDGRTNAIIAFVIIGVTFFTYLFNNFALRRLSPTVSGSYIYLQPMLAMGFAFLFFYVGWVEDTTKSITLEKIGYMLLIFAGVFFISRATYLERKKAKLMK